VLGSPAWDCGKGSLGIKLHGALSLYVIRGRGAAAVMVTVLVVVLVGAAAV